MLYTQQSGNPQNPAIVFLHGGGLSSKMWQPQLEALSTDFFCLAPDLPEQGQSTAIKPFTLVDSANRIADLITERVPGGKAHVVGLSLGGAVALTLLRTHPEVVQTALVSGTAAKLSRTLGWIANNSLWMLRLYTPQGLVKASLKQFGIPAQYQPLLADDLLVSASEDFNRSLYRELMEMELPTKAASPLLACVGQKETFAAKDAARKIVHEISGARGVVIPNCGHVWNLQNPALFNQVVRAWVTSAALPAELTALQ